MVDIIPFKGLIFNKNMVRDFSRVISPPYDVISPDLKERLKHAEEHNIVNLILPEGEGDERYRNAASLLEQWINEKILVFDNRECFYIIEISFKTGYETKKIMGFIGLTRIEPFKKGNIIPHEKTLSAPKEDRLKLLEKCRTNFGLIYTLYRDSENKIIPILDGISSGTPDADIDPYYSGELHFRLWRISDRENIAEIKSHMKNNRLLIADGHHRYETSMIFRDRHPEDKENYDESFFPPDYILTLYMESSQENIKIHPTYRMVRFRNFPGMENVLKILKNKFDSVLLDDDGRAGQEINFKLLSEARLKGEKAFIVTCGGPSYYLKYLESKYPPTGIREKYDNLDINILHNILLKTLQKEVVIENIGFTNSAPEVLSNIRKKAFDIGIFLNAPSISEMEEICLSGYLMPQKSTYFYPKPCSGLVMYKFER